MRLSLLLSELQTGHILFKTSISKSSLINANNSKKSSVPIKPKGLQNDVTKEDIFSLYSKHFYKTGGVGGRHIHILYCLRKFITKLFTLQLGGCDGKLCGSQEGFSDETNI